MVGGVERSFGTSVPFLIILYTKKIKNQGVLRKKSNSRSYFLKFRSQAEFAPWQARFSILPLFYICLAKALPRQKTPGQRSTRCKVGKAFPLTPPWAFDRGFCLGNFIYPLTPAGCPPLSGRRCCSAVFSPGESKKRLPPLREPESGAALKRRNAAAYPARAEKLSPHAAVGVRPWFLLERFYLPAHAGGLSAAPRSPVLLRRIFARREQKAAQH